MRDQQPAADTTAEDPFLLLGCSPSTARRCRPSSRILGFLIPLMAIGLGFDAINGEHNRRTLSRILAQPIYRDALLIGKFLAGLRHAGDQPGGAVAAGDRPRPDLPRRAAGRRGDRALAGVPGDRPLLCRRLARAGDAALDRVPLAGDRGAGRARRLAVPDRAVADAGPGAGAGDRAAGIRVRHARAAHAGDRDWAAALSRLSPNHLFGEAMLAVLSPSTRGRSARCFSSSCAAR